MKRLLVFLFLFESAAMVHATSFFVDALMGLDSRSKIQAVLFYYPWKHIQTGVDSAAAGDTLLVRGGTYVERVNISKQITILGISRDIAILQSPTDQGVAPAVTIAQGVDNVYITELTIDGASTATDGLLCSTGVDGLTLHHMIFRNCLGTGVRTTFDGTADGSINESLLIDSCAFVNILGGRSGNLPSCGLYADHVAHLHCLYNTFTRVGIGVWLGGSAWPDTTAGTGNIIRKSVMQDEYQNGIVAVSQSNLIIDSNIFRRCANYALPESAWSAAYPGTICMIGKSVNVQFLNNIVRDNGGVLLANSFYTNPSTSLLEGPGYSGWPAIFLSGDVGASVRFNTIFNNPYGGVFISGSGTYYVTDNYLYSNGSLNAANRDYGLAAPAATVTAGSNWWGNDVGPGYDGAGYRNGAFGNGITTTTGGVRGLTERNSFNLHYVPDRIICDIVHIGNYQDTSCLFYNDGVGPAFTDAPYIGGASSQYAVLSPTSSQVINPGDSVVVTFRFAPTELGLLEARVYIAPDTQDTQLGPLLYGFGGLAVLSTLDTLFFDTLAPQRCAVHSMLITNTGTELLSISSASIIGLDSSQFKLLEPLPLDLSPGVSQEFHLQYCPTSVGAKSARIIFSANTQPAATVVELRGASATVSRIVPSLINVRMGTLILGQHVDTIVTLRNTASVQLAIDSFRFANNAAGAFTLRPPIPDSIAAGDSAQLHLRFVPSKRDTESVVLTGTASDGTLFTINITGNGGIFLVAETPGHLFDSTTTTVGTHRQECAVIKNTGDFTFDIFLSQLTGDSAAAYTFVPVSSYRLVAGASDTICVDFHPTHAGTFPALIVIQYSEPSMKLDSIALNGSAIVVGVAENNIPRQALLVEHYPDPFSSSTLVRISGVAPNQSVSAILYDALGRAALDVSAQLRDQARSGSITFSLDATTLPAGMYLLRVVSGAQVSVQSFRKVQ